MKQLRVKLIWFQDIQHRTHIGVNICGEFMIISYNITDEYQISDIDLCDIFHDIMYCKENREEVILIENFIPHKVLNEEEYPISYFYEGEISECVRKVFIN